MAGNDQLREYALNASVVLWGDGRKARPGHSLGDAVIATAEKFHTFLTGKTTVGSESDIEHHLDRIEGEIMATQADIDALTTQLGTLKDTLTADDAAIQTEIANLQAQGVDTTALQAAVSDLSGAVDATSALVPAATTPPADGGTTDSGAPSA